MNRYGPDCVTSRPLSRCPAAQMRTISPTSAIAPPIVSDLAWAAPGKRRHGAEKPERHAPSREARDERLYSFFAFLVSFLSTIASRLSARSSTSRGEMSSRHHPAMRHWR